jgi:hypothetical protein
MTFNFFGSTNRTTTSASTSILAGSTSIAETSTTNNVPNGDTDSHVDTEAEMEEIRKALRAQQAMEDAFTDQVYMSPQNLTPEKNSSIVTMGTEALTPSPPRRKCLDHWDNEAEKKDDEDEVEDDDDVEATSKDAILYNEGATELFKCIEEGMWDRATKLLQSNPEQASIWIISTGTVNTTFNWSKWTRLPLHEAARRQPPTHFMTQLIATYPGAVKAVTQFGELPLHLAVECGASPGVVNLLAVSHWRGCHETDQSGRTPLDVLQENDLLLDPIEHKAVVAALQASAIAHQQILLEHANEIASIREEHAVGLEAVQEQHDEDLQEEQEQQENLLQQIATLQQQLLVANSVSAVQQTELHQLKQSERKWLDHVEQLQRESSAWKESYIREQYTSQDLRTQVSDRDAQAIVLADRIVDLQTCIQRLAHWHRTTVRKQLEKLSKSFECATKELSTFSTTLHDHEEDLQTLLVEIGGNEDIDTVPTATDSEIASQEQDFLPKSSYDDQDKVKGDDQAEYETFDDDEVAVSRATQSASVTVLR